MSYTLADAGIALEAAPTRLWITLPVGSAAKTAVKRAGAHWDPESLRWWIGKAKSEDARAALQRALPRAVTAYRRQEALASSETKRSRDEILTDPVEIEVGRSDRPTHDLIRAIGGWFAEGCWVVHRDDFDRVVESRDRDRAKRDMVTCPSCYVELPRRTWERSGCCFYGPGGFVGTNADGTAHYEGDGQ